MIQLIERAKGFSGRTAIISFSEKYSYKKLLETSGRISQDLLSGESDLKETRIAFLITPGFEYVSVQWGIWRAGGIAVPLCDKHPLSSIIYIMDDTGASVIVYSKEFEILLTPLMDNSNIRFIEYGNFRDLSGSLPDVHPSRRAMILYTSGTTGSPKGVVTTHQNIEAQVTSLILAWEWNPNDHILNILPLHHVHGIINVLCCALWSGACCEFLPKFDEEKVFEVFSKNEISLFMAVPTIYFKLAAYWKKMQTEDQENISGHLKSFRLMVSGSAALPVSILEEWERISGHTLLERYGMTEMGMAISNPYRGKRKPGYIGQALPGVEVRLAGDNGELAEEGSPGEIQVKGPNVFIEYWNKPDETKESFTAGGWFKTGDIAVYEDGSYKILGRNSVDIIKSGGYKISALEIEEALRSHPGIKDCGVVGIPDEEWGEIIGASLVLKTNDLSLEELKNWLKEKLPGYKCPRKYIFQEDLPRNVMGKVTKNELKKLFTS